LFLVFNAEAQRDHDHALRLCGSALNNKPPPPTRGTAASRSESTPHLPWLKRRQFLQAPLDVKFSFLVRMMTTTSVMAASVS